MEVPFEVDKIIKFTINNTVTFSLVGGVDEVLVKLQLIKKIIKDANMMCISFSVKYPHAFGN